MDPHLQRCRDGLRRAIDGLSPAAAEAPRGRKWSISQIIEHLDLAYTANIAGLDRRLRKGVVTVRRRSWKQRLAQFVVVRLGYFPSGRSSPDAVLPQGRPFADVAAGVDGHLIALDRRLSEVERMFGARRTVLDHPILGPFSVNDWRRFHWIHTRHHLRQIGR